VRGVSNEQTVMVGMSNPEDGLTPATIAARDKLKVYVDVEAGDKVACYVRVEQRGVEVAAALRPACGGKQAETTLLQKFKHKSDLGAWEKVIDIPQKGTLVLVLNNEYSMLNSKSVKYRVAVLEASDAERLSTIDDDRV
jgi:citrate lyase beta subunit